MRKHRLFLMSFIVTLMLLLFFLGNSITGNVIQSSYCDDKGCYDYCKSNTDCFPDETCCQEKTFGICKKNCDNEFSLKPEVEYPVPYTEQPVEIKKAESLFYVFLIFITLAIGAIYFLRNKIVHVKV